MSAKIHLVAVEDSADALGADVAKALRAQQPSVALSGVGGEQMRQLGIQSETDLSGLAILGLFDGVRALNRVNRAVQLLANEIETEQPDSVVLIDSWGLMWRLARELKQRSFPGRIVKLVGPQVWATRPGRAKVLARWCDRLLCLHDFERPFYEGTGLPTTVVGNPAIGRQPKGDGPQYRQSREIGETAKVVGLLLGSRRSEISRVGPAIVSAAHEIADSDPEIVFLCLPAPSVRMNVLELAKKWRFNHVVADPEEHPANVMAAMDVALACSGTVTTELAEQGVAIVTGYKLGWLSWALARAFLMRTKYISLLNVAAGEQVIPELVQTRLSPGNLSAAALRLLNDDAARALQVHKQWGAVEKLRGIDELSTAARSARAILEDLRPSISGEAKPSLSD